MAIGFALTVSAQSKNGAAADTDAKYATGLLQPGTKAPDFTMADADGRKHSLSDFKGKYVVLDFWASWCPDCRKDVPEVKRLHDLYGKNVEFVSVSFDNVKANWVNYVGKNGMSWLQLSELKKMREADITKLYKVSWIPSVYIIDRDGKIILSTVMIEKVAAKLKEITSKK